MASPSDEGWRLGSETDVDFDSSPNGCSTEIDRKDTTYADSSDYNTSDKKIKICAVCGDKALGNNFGVLTCEPCKAFFRRNAGKTFRGRCDGYCQITIETRQYCKHCRLKKCFAAGMKIQKLNERTRSTSSSSSSLSTNSPPECQTPRISLSNDESNMAFTQEESQIMDEIVTSSQIVLDTCQATPPNPNPSSYKDLVGMAEFCVRKVISFAKSLKFFLQIDREDQIVLLKGGMIEMLCVHSVRTYDSSQQAWLVKNKMSTEYIVESTSAFDSDTLQQYKQFAETLYALTMQDTMILSLLTALCLFSPDRPNLKFSEKISNIQERYANTLKKYLLMSYPSNPEIFPKLIVKLCDVRNQAEIHSKLMLNMESSNIDPLLLEVFNLEGK